MKYFIKLISYSELYEKRRRFIAVAFQLCFKMPIHMLRMAADTDVEMFTSVLVYTVDIIT